MPIEPQAPYISSKEASKKYGLTHDHIGLLCRKGKIQGLLWGRIWFISEPSLQDYIQKNLQIKEARKEALSKQWRTAWTAAFVGLFIFASSANYAAADLISMPAKVAAPQVVAPISLNAIVSKVGEIKNQIPVPQVPVLVIPAAAKEQTDSKFFSNVGDGLYVVGEVVVKTFEAQSTEKMHVTYAKDFEPESTEPISTFLTSAVANAKVFAEALPVPEAPHAPAAEEPVFTIKNILSGLEGVGENLGAVSFPLIDTTPRIKTVTYSAPVAEQKITSPEPISAFFTAAVMNAGAVAATLPVPDVAFEMPKVEQTLTAENFLAGTMFANEVLGTLNDNILALYLSSLNAFGRVVAFDAGAGAHVWQKTFGAFGEEFVSDLARLNDLQIDFYFAAANALDQTYNSVADAVGATTILDSSVSVASSNFAPTLTIPGQSQLAGVWSGLVNFLAETFFTPKVEVAEQVPTNTAPEKTISESALAKPASENSSGRLTSQNLRVGFQNFPTQVSPTQANTTLQKSGSTLLQGTYSPVPYITQESLNKQFDAWMLVVKSLLSTNTGGGGGSNTVINNYSQKIDKLNGVTITNSSINGVSDFSNLGGADVLTDLTDTLIASQTYGDLLMYNGTKWVNIATSSLGLAGAGNGSIGSGTTGQVAYFSGTNTAVGTSSLYIGTNGRIGIGTTSPVEILSVAGSTSVVKIKAYNTASTGASSLQVSNSNDDSIEYLLYGRDAVGTYFSGVNRAGGAFLGGSPNSLMGIGTRTATPLLFATNNLERFRVDSSGNVGIGTTSPYAKLSVVGDVVAARFFATSTATSTFAGAIQATCFSTDGSTCLSSGSSLTGTTGQLAYFSGTNTAVGTSTLFISTAGYVGIGTTTPAYPLDINGNVQIEGTSLFLNPYGASVTNGVLDVNNTRAQFGYDAVTSNAFVKGGSGKGILFLTNAAGTSNPSGVFTSIGNFGVGTTSPFAKLSINNSTADTAGAPLFVVASSTATATTTSFIITNAGNVGIGTSNPQTPLSIYPTIDGTAGSSVDKLAFFDDGTYIAGLAKVQGSMGGLFARGSTGVGIYVNTTYGRNSTNDVAALLVRTNGNVGIGTTTSQQKLSVSSASDTRVVIDTSVVTAQSILSFQNQGAPKFEVVSQPSGGSQYLSIARYAQVGKDFNISSAGNVGVGTTSPYAKLSVFGGGDYSAQAVSTLFAIGSTTQGTATSTLLAVLSSGTVGIGTAAPAGALDVVGVAGSPSLIRGNNSTNSNASILTITNTGVSGGTTGTSFYNDGGNNVGIRLADTNGAIVRTQLGVNTATYFANNTANNVGVGTSSPWAKFSIANFTGDTAGQPLFAVASSTASATSTLFAILNSGNVGIGTTNPSATLEAVANNTLTNGVTTVLNLTHNTTGTASAGIGTGMRFFAQRQDGTTIAAAGISGILTGVGTGSNTNGALSFLVSPDSSGLSEAARFTSNGNFGIGSTSPWGQLSVNPNGISGPAFVVGSSTQTLFTITNAGNIGVGTASPSSAISASRVVSIYDTVGNGASLNLRSNNSWNAGIMQTGGSLLQIYNRDSVAAVNITADVSPLVGIGTTSPWAQLSVNPNGISGPAFAVGSSTQTLFSITNSGNVGIGTAAPSSLMQIVDVSKNSNTDTGAISNYFLTIQRNANNNNTGTGIAFINSNDTQNIGASIISTRIGTNGQSTLDFYTKTSTNLGASPVMAMRISESGYIGLGTTSPYAKLSVVGDIVTARIFATSTATSTFAGPIQATCFSTDGNTCITGTGATINGTTGQLAYFSGTNTAVGTSSLFISTAGNVGVGTSTPQRPLHVAAVTPTFILENTGNAANAHMRFISVDNGGGMSFGKFSDAMSSTQHMVLDSGGNLGIGTTSPWAQLSVNPNGISGPAFVVGSTTASSFVITNSGAILAGGLTSTVSSNFALQLKANGYDGNGTGAILVGSSNSAYNVSIERETSTSNGVINLYPGTTAQTIQFNGGTNKNSYFNTGGNLGIGSTSPWAQLSVNPNGISGPAFVIGSSTATKFFVSNGGQVGIGNAAPQSGFLLDVSGQAVIRGSTYVSGALIEFGTTAYKFSQVGASWVSNASGNFGIGTSSPWGKLSVNNFATDTGGQPLFVLASSTASATTTLFSISNIGVVNLEAPGAQNWMTFTRAGTLRGSFNSSNNIFAISSAANDFTLGVNSNEVIRITTGNNVGIGTSSPYAKLSVVGEIVGANLTATSTTATSTIAGGLNVGSGAITYDFSSGVTSINNLALGSFTFDTDAGIVSWADLPISSTTAAGTVESYTANIGGSNVLTIYGEADGAGNARNLRVGIGTTSPNSAFVVVDGRAGNEVATFINSSTGSGDEVLHLGVGNATAGTSNLFVAFYQGSGTSTMGTRIGYIQGSGSNSVTYNTTSDRRLKENIASTTHGLTDLMKISVSDFNFRNSSSTVQGFIAQQLNEVYPYAVASTDNGTDPLGADTIPWGVDYGRITPLIVKAVQDIANITNSFKDNLIAWFADKANGITKLFAKEVHTDKLCVGNTCVTEEQFLALVAGSLGHSPTGEAGSSSGGSSTPEPEAPTPIPDENASSAPEVPVVEEGAASAEASAGQASSTPSTPEVETPVVEEEQASSTQPVAVTE